MDTDSYLSSSPSITEEEIDFQYVYAIRTFVATEQGQANVVKGDAMILLNDINSYWWLVRLLKDSSVGFLPAEHIETPSERLARLNKHRNGEFSSPSFQHTATIPPDSDDSDAEETVKKTATASLKKKGPKKLVTFTQSLTYVSASEYEYSDDEDDENLNEEHESDSEAEEEPAEPVEKEPEQDIAEVQDAEDKKSNSIFSLMSRNKRRSTGSDDLSHSKQKSIDTLDSVDSSDGEKAKRRSLLSTKSSTDTLKKPVSDSNPSSGISGLFKRITRKDSVTLRHEAASSEDRQKPPKLRIEPVEKSTDAAIVPPEETTKSVEPLNIRSSMYETPTQPLNAGLGKTPRRSASDGANAKRANTDVVAPLFSHSKTSPIAEEAAQEEGHLHSHTDSAHDRTATDTPTLVADQHGSDDDDNNPRGMTDFEHLKQSSASTVADSTGSFSPTLLEDRDDASTGASTVTEDETTKTMDPVSSVSPQKHAAVAPGGGGGALDSLLAESSKIHPEIVAVFRETSIRLDNMNSKLELLLNTYGKKPSSSPGLAAAAADNKTGIYAYNTAVVASNDDIYG